jgi:hypothetical protein
MSTSLFTTNIVTLQSRALVQQYKNVNTKWVNISLNHNLITRSEYNVAILYRFTNIELDTTANSSQWKLIWFVLDLGV